MGELSSLESRYGAANYKPLPVTLVRGKGVHVWDEDGRRYIDMMGAYSAVSFGHCHPSLVEAMTRQARRLDTVSRAYFTDRLGPFLARACALTGMEAALPANGGAEAVEDCAQGGAQMGLQGQGRASRVRRDHCGRRQFPRPHHRHCGLLVRAAIPQGLWSFPGGIQACAFWRRRRARGRYHPLHSRIPDRADPG
jgi:hypothetical protein